MPTIETCRLRMIPFTLNLMKAALSDKDQLAGLCGARISAAWPQPDFAGVLPYLIANLEKEPWLPVWDGLIIHKEDNMVIGDMGLKGGPDQYGVADVGYSIVPAYRNRGYATEMLSGLITWSFAHGLSAITAECLQDNQGSIRVLEKAGLGRVGLGDNLIKWELSRKDEL